MLTTTGWRGRNERTGQEGIFPRSYVNVIDEKPSVTSPVPAPTGNNYGNMPLAVSQSGSASDPAKHSKMGENGKKFGKKVGNAGELQHFCPWSGAYPGFWR